MRRRSHSLEANDIDDRTWFYDDRKGLQVVRDVRNAVGGYICTEMFIIPWRMVIAATKRHELRPRGGEDVPRKKPSKKPAKKSKKRK